MEADRMTHVLDHGYVRFVEAWGSDRHIVEAARMSTDKGFLGWGPSCEQCRCNTFQPKHKTGDPCPACSTKLVAGDEKLLAYLSKNKHDTPFEFAGLVVEVQAPIFVFREWHRHRTQSYNEMSARYTPMPDLHYVPSVERLMINSKTNKQAGTIAGAEELTKERAETFRKLLIRANNHAQEVYERGLDWGVPKELARLPVPVNRYSRMRASANLRNWLGFLTLRMAPGAQWEIRQYANAVATFVAESFPRTHALFVEGNVG